MVGGLGWFAWSLLWIAILTVAAAPIGLALAAAETFLWRLMTARFPAPERNRATVVLSPAVIALPWASLVPWVLADWLKGPWPAAAAD